MARLKMQISATFDCPTTGVFATWSPTEQARAIEAEMQRLVSRSIKETLGINGVEAEPSVAILVCAL